MSEVKLAVVSERMYYKERLGLGLSSLFYTLLIHEITPLWSETAIPVSGILLICKTSPCLMRF